MTLVFACTCGCVEASCRPRALSDFLRAHGEATVKVEAVYADQIPAAICRYAKRGPS